MFTSYNRSAKFQWNIQYLILYVNTKFYIKKTSENHSTLMEHFNGILFHKFGPANKAVYKSINQYEYINHVALNLHYGMRYLFGPREGKNFRQFIKSVSPSIRRNLGKY